MKPVDSKVLLEQIQKDVIASYQGPGGVKAIQKAGRMGAFSAIIDNDVMDAVKQRNPTIGGDPEALRMALQGLVEHAGAYRDFVRDVTRQVESQGPLYGIPRQQKRMPEAVIPAAALGPALPLGVPVGPAPKKNGR